MGSSSLPYLSFLLSFFPPFISTSPVSLSPPPPPPPLFLFSHKMFPRRLSVCLWPLLLPPSSLPPPLSFGQLDNHFVNTLNLKKKRRRNHGMKSRCGWSAAAASPPPPCVLHACLPACPLAFLRLAVKKSPSVSFTFYIVHNNAMPPPRKRTKKRNFCNDVTYSAIQSFVGRCRRRNRRRGASTPVRPVFVPISGRAPPPPWHDMMID